jgi:tRNA A-37 threonylcarbamoyl transferase component Bud32
MSFQQPFSGYEILARIGSGSMGTVFKARQRRLNRIVALKVLKPSLARNEVYVDRLRREARIVAALNHPNIVAGYDLGEEGGYHFFVMEYVDGKSLRELLAEWGSFPEEQVLDVAIQVASALDHAFQKGVIHRDIKPGNILIDAGNRVKLTDMGLAKGPQDLTLTRQGATVGTPQYISPEQARDPQSADVRSDLYSLGATLFHMATGSLPFPGQTLAEVLTKVLGERAPSAHGVNPSLSEGLSLVLRKLLSKDRDLRYQTPAELLADLRRVQRAERPEVDVRRLDEAESGRRPRRRALALAGAVVLAASLAAGWWWFSERGEPSDPADELRSRLAAELAQESGFRGKLALLRRTEAAVGDELRAVVRDLSLAVEASFEAEIGRQLDGIAADPQRLSAFLAQQDSWIDPQRAFDEWLARQVWDSHELRPESLSGRVRAAFDRRRGTLLDLLQPLLAERERRLVTQFRDWLASEVQQGWQELLVARDFAAAEVALRQSIAGFFGRDGNPPREVLGAELRREFDRLEADAVGAASKRIDAEEKQAAEDLLREAGDALAVLRLQRNERDPGRLLRETGRLREELERRNPRSSFRRGQDPWPDVDRQLRSAEFDLRSALQARDELSLASWLEIAYGSVLEDGEPEAAATWLGALEFGTDVVRDERERHRRLLLAAGKARARLLAALGDRGDLRVRRRADPAAAAVAVEVRRDARGALLVLRGVATVERVGAGEILWSDLIAAAGAALEPVPADPELQRGLAFWLALAGEQALALQRYGRDQAEFSFFAEKVVALLARLKPPTAEVRSARELLTQLASALEAGSVDALAAALEVCKPLLSGELPPSDRALLKEAELRLKDERERAALRRDLQQQLPRGAQIEVPGRQELQVTYDLRRGERGWITGSWLATPESLRWPLPDVDLAKARAEALALPSGFERSATISAEIALRLPPPGPCPRVYLFELHGAGVLVALLQNDTVWACVFEAEQLERPDVVRRLLQKHLKAVVETPRAVAVPGAEHMLRIELRAGQRQRQSVLVWFDAVELASGQATRDPPRTFQGLRVQPLHVLDLLVVRLHRWR